MLELMCAFTSLSKFFMMVDVKSHMMVLIRHSTLLFFGTGLLEEGWDFRMEEWEVKDFCKYLCQLIHIDPEDAVRDTIWTSCFPWMAWNVKPEEGVYDEGE